MTKFVNLKTFLNTHLGNLKTGNTAAGQDYRLSGDSLLAKSQGTNDLIKTTTLQSLITELGIIKDLRSKSLDVPILQPTWYSWDLANGVAYLSYSLCFRVEKQLNAEDTLNVARDIGSVLTYFKGRGLYHGAIDMSNLYVSYGADNTKRYHIMEYSKISNTLVKDLASDLLINPSNRMLQKRYHSVLLGSDKPSCYIYHDSLYPEAKCDSYAFGLLLERLRRPGQSSDSLDSLIRSSKDGETSDEKSEVYSPNVNNQKLKALTNYYDKLMLDASRDNYTAFLLSKLKEKQASSSVSSASAAQSPSQKLNVLMKWTVIVRVLRRLVSEKLTRPDENRIVAAAWTFACFCEGYPTSLTPEEAAIYNPIFVELLAGDDFYKRSVWWFGFDSVSSLVSALPMFLTDNSDVAVYAYNWSYHLNDDFIRLLLAHLSDSILKGGAALSEFHDYLSSVAADALVKANHFQQWTPAETRKILTNYAQNGLWNGVSRDKLHICLRSMKDAPSDYTSPEAKDSPGYISPKVEQLIAYRLINDDNKDDAGKNGKDVLTEIFFTPEEARSLINFNFLSLGDIRPLSSSYKALRKSLVEMTPDSLADRRVGLLRLNKSVPLDKDEL